MCTSCSKLTMSREGVFVELPALIAYDDRFCTLLLLLLFSTIALLFQINLIMVMFLDTASNSIEIDWVTI